MKKSHPVVLTRKKVRAYKPPDPLLHPEIIVDQDTHDRELRQYIELQLHILRRLLARTEWDVARGKDHSAAAYAERLRKRIEIFVARRKEL